MLHIDVASIHVTFSCTWSNTTLHTQKLWNHTSCSWYKMVVE